MKTKLFLTATLLSFYMFAADKIQPLNAKLGLWEITMTQQMAGVPPIPPETLAKMTPEERARMEAMFKQRAGQAPSARTTQTCLTKEKLDKAPFSESSKACQRTIVSSTSKLTEVHEECAEPDGSKRVMDGRFELTGDNNMKGSMRMKASNSGRAMNINIDLTGKWLKEDCGSLK
jgi:hypothetical protein